MAKKQTPKPAAKRAPVSRSKPASSPAATGNTRAPEVTGYRTVGGRKRPIFKDADA